MITVWGRRNSVNVQKALWVLAECGQAFVRKDVGGEFGGLDTEAYGRLNPNRRIPTIEDGGIAIWESNVIVRYVAARHGTAGLYPEDFAARAHADMWMEWTQTTLVGAMNPLFWQLVCTPPAERDMAAIVRGATETGGLWQRFEAWLDGRAYVAGDDFSMGDIPIGALAWRYSQLDCEKPALPRVTAWLGRLGERAAFREHVALPLT